MTAPSHEELRAAIGAEERIASIAERYGVSRNTVYTWAAAAGISFGGPGLHFDREDGATAIRRQHARHLEALSLCGVQFDNLNMGASA